MFSGIRERIEDARAAETIIGLGCSEYIEAFGVIWKTTGDEALAEKEAIKYMLNVRKDLKSFQEKMHNPQRMFSNRVINEVIIRVAGISINPFKGYRARRNIIFKDLQKISEVL